MSRLGIGIARKKRMYLGLRGSASNLIDFGIIIAGHQSNMTGGQLTATGATIIAADDPDPRIWQYSPNGGTGAGDPAHTQTLEMAIEPLRYPNGVAIDANVGPALTYAKGVLASSQFKNIVIIPGGKGGTPLTDWVAGQPLFDSMVSAYTALRALLTSMGKTFALHSVIMSPLENEMTGTVTPAATATRLDNTINAYRALAGASVNTPIYLGAAAPDYVVGNAPYLAILLEGAKAAVRHPNVGVLGGYTGGSTPGDTVHYTNVANRARGTQFVALQARTAALQSAAPPAVSAISAASQTITFTSTGAPYYTIHVGTPGQAVPYGDAGTDYVPNADNVAGTVYANIPMPGSGSRDVYIVAHGRGGDSAPSPVVNYTASGASVPARVIELDFANAAMSGANMVTVPSSGTDTTNWVPISSAGSGALALITQVAQNAINIANLSNANKRFRRSGFVFPAGDYSFGFPVFIPSPAPGAGTLVAWGQSSTSGDIYISLANTGVNIKCQNNTTASAVITTGAPLTGLFNKWHYIGVSYDRTLNVFHIYLNDVDQALSGTPNLRSASPANSGGTDLYGFNADANSNGMICKPMPVRYWSQVITQAQFAADRAALETTYGMTFG